METKSLKEKFAETEYLRESIETQDSEVYEIIKKEKERQIKGLELIASENFASRAVLDALGSCLNDKYSEGYPGARYYGGTENIDRLELLCQDRALKAYGLSKDEWGINVQPYSGSPANFAVFTGVVGPHGRIMGLDLPDGGHLTHGFYTEKKKVSATSIFFESFPYNVYPDTGLINYDALEESAVKFRPKVIIAGMSCYARNIDYARMRSIADKCGALLHSDMAHITGLVAAGCVPGPFEHSDIVTCTTHKTLRGPRSGLIFYRVGVRNIDKQGREVHWDIKKKIDEALFPGLQGGPHNHAIGGVAVALKQALEQPFKDYSIQTCRNATALANELVGRGYNLVTGGTDNHLMLVDLRRNGSDGNRTNAVLDRVHFVCNKNTVPGDKSAMRPSGIRLGTPALTSRGMDEADMLIIAEFFDKGVKIAAKCQAELENRNNFKDFKMSLEKNYESELSNLKTEIEQFAAQFPIPGKTYD